MRPHFYFLNRASLSLLILLLLSTLTFRSHAQSGSATTTQSFSYTGQIVTWTVPTGVSSLTIEARGAEGGGGTAFTYAPGKGAVIRGALTVTPGQALSILVGQQPTQFTRGGGGGSFVVTGSNSLQPLIIAGGGGGAGGVNGGTNSGNYDSNSKEGQTANNAGKGTGPNNSGGAGGTTGGGGNAGSGQVNAAGGGGLTGNGQDASFSGGKSFVNGGAGGAGSGANSDQGGFGGGGSSNTVINSPSAYAAGGGGGGYTGGGGGSYSSGGAGVGGGGGSFNSGTNQTNTSGANSGNGLVTITYATPTQPIRYVKQGGSGMGNGTSWDNASGDLQSQIDIAGAEQVWVAAGRYTPTSISGFSLKNGVSVYGGFASGEQNLSDRPGVNPVGGRPSSTTIASNRRTNGISRPVFRNGGLDTTARLDGVVITGGDSFEGGGINNSNSSPVLTNCLITGNLAVQKGGGIFNTGSSPVLINCVISGNSLADLGGPDLGVGIYNIDSSPVLTNCIISGNLANSNSRGGGLYNENSNPVLTNCLISGNSATDLGGGIYNTGSSPRLVNCTLTGNRAGAGAALINYNGSQPVLTNTILWDNQESANTAINNENSGVTANYSLIGTGETDFTGSNNQTTTVSPFTSGADFTLKAGSQAIDAGNPASTTATSGATDLAGNPRFYQGGRIDIGAYEFQALPTQPIRYVKAGGTGDGTSWANASGDLQSQIDIAGAQQVWVAGGTYYPTTGLNRNVSLSLKSGVAVYGGFRGMEQNLTERPPVNPTTGNPSSATLSGDIGRRGDNTDNSYHVLSNTNVASSAVLDGFVITRGGAIVSSRNGGGMLNSSSSPSLVSCSFYQNQSNRGGGIYNSDDSSPTLTNCLFSQNTAGSGAGICTEFRSNLRLINCLFSQNTAGFGGALYNRTSVNMVAVNCSFDQNAATTSGGGGLYNSENSTARLTNCSFSQNTAVVGGAVRNLLSATAILTNCIVWDNGGPNAFINTPTGTNETNNTTADYSLIESGATDYTGSNNLIATNSPFVSATDLQLQPCSSAIDAGDNSANLTTTDLAGNTRRQRTIDMGAYEFQGTPNSPVAITQQPVSGSSACVGSTVTAMVSVSGTSPAYQWYKDGQVLTGVASATTATLTLSNVQPADAGNYSVVVTGSCPGSVTSTAFSLTVNAPATPTLVTRSGGPYPAGVSSLTISQNVGDVILTTSGCAGGTLTWAGGMATTLAVSTASTGTQTFTATCTLNGCTSPAATATVTVVPTSLRVLQRDPDNGQLGTNTLKPYLLLENIGTTPIPYAEITVRYWLTVEDPAPLMAQINSQLGNGNVRFTSVPVRPTRQGADTYLEFSFTPGAGSLGAMSNSGEIQISVLKQDYSGFNQGDDYSYVLNRDLTLNPRITAYRTGPDGTPTIIFGQEPGGVVNAPLRVMVTANPATITTAGTTTLTAMASGGTGPYLYTFTGPGTIVQNGGNTATVTGLSATIHTFTVQVTDLTQPANQTASAQVSVTVNPAPPANTAPVAAANNSQTATVGQFFTYTVNAFTDAETPNSLTYSATVSPTNGFSFDPATRVLSGTPTATGVSSVTVTAIDPGGLSASTVFTITVNPAPVVVTPLALTLTASPTTILTTATTTLSATVSGGTPGAPDRAYTYTFSGPGTITQTGNTATTSNLPAGVQTFTVVVTDATQPTSQTITGTVSVTVNAVAVATQLTVLQRDPDNGQLNTNTLKPYLQLRNDGTNPIPYAEITLRYWLTVENPAPLMYQIGSQLGNGNVRVNYVSINPLRPGATGYLEFSFAPGAGSLGAMRNSGDIQVSATKQDYSAFNQGDDYSYVLNRDFAPNARITAYRNGQLIYGTEPARGTRVGVESTPMPLEIVVLGNPVVGSEVTVEIGGAQGQPLRMELTDLTGRLVSEQSVGRAGTVERARLPLGNRPAGVLLLRVSTPTQSQTVKVLKNE